MKILIVCSSGGHFHVAEQIRDFWQQYDRVWVTFKTVTTQEVLETEKVYWAYSPTNRNLVNLIRNLFLAGLVIYKEKPQVTITTGAGVAVPFLIIAKMFGSQTVFIESITRVKNLSLSARLILPFLDILYVHWQELKNRYPKAELISHQT